MKPLVASLALLVVMSGCSKPPAQEYMRKAQDAEKGGLWSIALENYQKLITEHPGDSLAETATFNIAAIQHNNKNYQAAVDGYKAYLTVYPDGSRAPTALFLVAFLYNNDLKNLDSAKRYFEEFISKYPKHEMASSAEFELQHLGQSPEELLPKPALVDENASAPDKKGRAKGKN